jgi:hypothetical protein
MKLGSVSMKVTVVLIIVAVIASILSSEVVINELLYDPEGADSGYEWIELYNNEDNSVQLQDWQLQKAGSQFESFYTFPSYTLEPYSFLLIGESNIDEADLITNLAMQNGGSCTDGVRLLAADSSYTDTILYDTPNSNKLPCDVNQPGLFFAIDVDSSNSLARVENGIDTNNCQEDWFECDEPTPGLANIYPIDLAVELLEIDQVGQQIELEIEVFNLSTQPVDNSDVCVKISSNQHDITEVALPEISAGGSYLFTWNFEITNASYYYYEVEVICLQDNNLENNKAKGSVLYGASPIILNEVMFDPAENAPEWLELYVRDGCEYNVDNLRITDAAAGEIYFTGYIYDYVVICENKQQLLAIYSDLNTEKILQADNWTTLNNSEENLLLHDDCGTVLDTLSYEGSEQTDDISLERVDPYCDEDITWLPSVAVLGATPAAANSVLPATTDLTVHFSSIQIQNQQLQHSVLLKNIGLDLINNTGLDCLFSQNAADFQLLEQFNLEVTDSLQFTFTSSLPDTGYYVFKYQVNSAQDVVPENDSTLGFYNQNALPLVVNEIMFDPLPEQPEWLELKQNYLIEELDSLLVVCNEDSFWIESAADEYFLITSHTEAAEFLQAQHDMNLSIETGLPNLANNGETIKLYDQQLNLLDSLTYNDDWNYSENGISAERVNSLLPATTDNWGPCVDGKGNSLGSENSIYTQNFSTHASLEVKPNPFCPVKGQRTIISYNLPEKISRTTVRVFDLKGRLIDVIKDQGLVAAKGEIIWDGRNKKDKVISVGLYIILFQATGVESERVFSKTKTITIAR